MVEQTQTWYDDDGNAIATATFQRLPDDPAGAGSTGALTAADSYVTVTKTWYDAAGRDVEDVNYGREDVLDGQTSDFFVTSNDSSNGTLAIDSSSGVPYIVEDSAPTRNSSGNYIVSQTIYDLYGIAGRRQRPRGRQVDRQRRQRHLDRVRPHGPHDLYHPELQRRRVFLRHAGVPGRGHHDHISIRPLRPHGDHDRLRSPGAGQPVQQQATKYLYQSSLAPSLQTAVVYPDSTDRVSQDSYGDWFIWSGTDHTSTTYDLLGRPVTSTDQRGVVHSYVYDFAGRLSKDLVTSLGYAGQNVDGSVRLIVTTYDDLGRVQTVTSYADTGMTTIVNQVVDAYDGWGNLAQEWQNPAGAVDTSSTPSVQYVYSDGANSGVAGYVRLTDVIYPSGQDIAYGYGAAG